MKIKKKTVKNRLDKLWSKMIRDCDKCAICGVTSFEKQLHPHHIIGRMRLRTRWDIKNGICLCASHHTLGKLSAHADPLWFNNWLIENKPEDFQYLMDVKREPLEPMSVEDYLEIETNLKLIEENNYEH